MKTGLSTGNFSEEYLAAIKEAGIECIEVSPSFPQHDTLDFAELKRLADKYGLELWSYHLRFGYGDSYEISNLNEELRKQSVENQKGFIKKAADIGIKNFIIHPSGEPISNDDRPAAMEQSKKTLKALAEYADTLGAVICVEDLPRTCLGRDSEEMKKLLSADERLRVCFDVNHLLKEGTTEFLLNISDRLQTLHISDYDFIDEKHWLPGEGDIEWYRLYENLEAVGYNGPFLYEVSMGEAVKGVSRSRALTPADIKRNHNEIAGLKPLTKV